MKNKSNMHLPIDTEGYEGLMPVGVTNNVASINFSAFFEDITCEVINK